MVIGLGKVMIRQKLGFLKVFATRQGYKKYSLHCRMSFFKLHIDSSTSMGEEQLHHHPKVTGFHSPTAAGTRREKWQKVIKSASFNRA
jgi:hypothetical protein